MENTPEKKPSGLSRRTLRILGYLFLAAGLISRSILQKELLGIGQLSGQQLMELMQSTPDAMAYATAALILQALECCAASIFAFLLVDGFQRTSCFRRYVLSVAGVALLSELPYNFAISGKVLDTATRNPVWGLVLGLFLLYLFRHFSEASMQNRFIKLLVALAALLWASMFKVDSGICMVILVGVLWAFRKRALYQNIAGATAAMVCTLLSPFYLASPMGFLLTHFYNGEKGAGHRLAAYLTYPILLLAVGLAAKFAF